MLRIKDIGSLIFFKPDGRIDFQHIESLCSEAINCDLLTDNLNDMLRVAVSISEGKVTASTVIRLVANLVILYNVNTMSKANRKLKREGMEIPHEALCRLSPYRKEHISQYSWQSRRNGLFKIQSLPEL